MNKLIKEMQNILEVLRDRHHVCGLKLSFEDEGALLPDAQRFVSMADRLGLPVSLKIGGCEAKKDIHDARMLGVKKLVAPMIESSYALKKFIQSAQSVYSDDEMRDTQFMINIETITGYNALEEILTRAEADFLSGVVVGRVDMLGSLGLSRDDLHCETITGILNDVAAKLRARNIPMLVGGALSSNSIPFLQTLPEDTLKHIETRNVIFDAQAALHDPEVHKGLVLAVGFELKWMQSKALFYGRLSTQEASRIQMIEVRYNYLCKRHGIKDIL